MIIIPVVLALLWIIVMVRHARWEKQRALVSAFRNLKVLTVRLSADTRAFNESMRRASESMRNFSRAASTPTEDAERSVQNVRLMMPGAVKAAKDFQDAMRKLNEAWTDAGL